jgi:hypothetical protein
MISSSYFNKFDDVLSEYLPARGQGPSKATQMVTAINKLIFKFYNDGDVFDNTHLLAGWANDLSSYANWLVKYVPITKSILDGIEDCVDESDYAELLVELADRVLTPDFVSSLESEPTEGDIYNCSGPYEFVLRDEDEDDDIGYDQDDDSDDEY